MNLITYTKWFSMNLSTVHLRDGVVEQIFKNNLLTDYLISTDDVTLSDSELLNRIHLVLSQYTFQDFCSLIKLTKFGIRGMDQVTIEDWQSGLQLAGIKVNDAELIFKFQFKPKSKLTEVFGGRTILNMIFNIFNGEAKYNSLNFETINNQPQPSQPNG